MDPQIAVDVGRQAVQAALLMAAPVLAVAVLTGIVVGMLQAVTRIHDPSILFAARIVAALVVIGICLPWLAEYYTGYSREVIDQIPRTISARGPVGILW